MVVVGSDSPVLLVRACASSIGIFACPIHFATLASVSVGQVAKTRSSELPIFLRIYWFLPGVSLARYSEALQCSALVWLSYTCLVCFRCRYLLSILHFGAQKYVEGDIKHIIIISSELAKRSTHMRTTATGLRARLQAALRLWFWWP